MLSKNDTFMPDELKSETYEEIVRVRQELIKDRPPPDIIDYVDSISSKPFDPSQWTAFKGVFDEIPEVPIITAKQVKTVKTRKLKSSWTNCLPPIRPTGNENMAKQKKKASSNYYKVNIKQFLRACKFVTKIKAPILIRGRHGIGKSEVVAQFAKSINYQMVDRRASQMSEGDLSGVPVALADVTKFKPLDWFWECCQYPRVLFLDELDRADDQVRQGFFELADSRKIFGHKLHPETIVFCAINGGNADNIHYMTNDMGPAELDRWTVFDFEPTVEEWMEWGSIESDGVFNVCQIVRDYIKLKPSALEYKGAWTPNKVYPSRRSWTRFSRCIQGESDLLRDSTLLTAIASGFVGAELATGFAEFALSYKFRITPEHIMKGGFWEDTKGYNSREHLRLIEEFATYDAIHKTDFKDLHYQNLWDYVKTLESELYMKFHSVINGTPTWANLIRVTKEECVNRYNYFLGISDISENADSINFGIV